MNSSTGRQATKLKIAAIGLGACAAALCAHAEWPEKPIRLVLSQAAGSQPDIIARLIGERLAKEWGQAVIVDNKAGGGNSIGAMSAAKSAPDGYTFYYATTAALVTNSFTFKSLPYDPAKDFVPVAFIAKSPFVIAVNPKLPVKSYPELVALAKSQPGALSFASDGPKGFAGMLGEWLNKVSRTSIVQVPYTNNFQGVIDTVSGTTQVTVQGTSTVMPFVQRGELRLIAVTTAKRIPGLDDVPTLGETVPGFEFVGWQGLVAPAGTPADIVEKVNRDVNKVLAQPDMVARIDSLHLVRDGSHTTSAQFSQFVAAQRKRWAEVVKTIGIQPD